jgi:uncharacterized Zn ribbon protein
LGGEINVISHLKLPRSSACPIKQGRVVRRIEVSGIAGVEITGNHDEFVL